VNVERLSRSPIGSIVPIVRPDPATRETVAGEAFLPAPLPREITLSTRTWTTVNAATGALARLDGVARLIPAPELLRRPTLRQEAQSTSALEGTYAPFVEVLAAERDDAGSLTPQLREILNFESMAELAFSWPDDRPITLGMLGELQRVLVRGTIGELSDAGGLRDRIVVIGARGRRLDDARFVPPPPGDQLRAGVEDLLAWIHDPPELPTVVQAAMAHYQFECLHPYSDGNGRLGRLLVILQLLRGAVIREPLLVVSPWFEQRRERYQDALLQLSIDGNWSVWVQFFAEGVAASATASERKVERLLELQNQLRGRVQAAGRRGAAERLAGDLVGRPFVTGPEVARAYELSLKGASNAIRTLVDLGVLEPLSGPRRRGAQLYLARAVLEALTDGS
jgi:Fic family protein